MTKIAAAIIYSHNQILICKRKPGGLCGGLWEFPGGKIEQGETPRQCMEREVMEELSVTVKDIVHYISFPYSYGTKEMYFSFFKAELWEGSPMSHVHDEIKWVSPSSLSQYTFCPANVGLINQILAEQRREQ